MAQFINTLDQSEIQKISLQDRREAFKSILQAGLNKMLQVESSEQIKSGPYERTEERTDSRNGTRDRELNTRIGQIVLCVHRHRNIKEGIYMKFAIAVDLEGMPGVVGAPGTGLDRELCPEEYDLAVKTAVACVNAAAKVLFDSGADEVLVWDNHGAGRNLPLSFLDDRLRILRGPSYERWAGIDESFAGAMLFGYHAMAGTTDGVLSHTYDSSRIQYIAINGVKVGEMAIDAHLAAVKGVPIICVLSDKAGIDEAHHFLPWAEGIITKRGFYRNNAIVEPLETCLSLVKTKVKSAIDRLPEMQLFSFETPMNVEYRFMRMEQANERVLNGAERVDAYTVVKRMDQFVML